MRKIIRTPIPVQYEQSQYYMLRLMLCVYLWICDVVNYYQNIYQQERKYIRKVFCNINILEKCENFELYSRNILKQKLNQEVTNFIQYLTDSILPKIIIPKQRQYLNKSTHLFHQKMHHSKNNYDTKSSIFSAEYKIPYQCSQNSRIVQHLEQSQQQLQFLKIKLTQAYQKLEVEIRHSMKLQHQNDELWCKIKQYQQCVRAEQMENNKLKQVMETVIKNRKLIQEQLDYTHARYKKILAQKQQNFAQQKQKLEKQIIKMKKQVQFMQEELNVNQKALNRNSQNKQYTHQLQIKIQTLENQIKRLTEQKVTEANRLRHEIQCYQRSSLSPIKQYKSSNRTLNVQSQNDMNKQNYNHSQLQMSVIQSNIYESKNSQQSIGKWKKNSKIVQKPISMASTNNEANINSSIVNTVKKQMTDDQKLTRCQIDKKRIETQLIKIQRLKRHTPEDRIVMEQLQKKLYNLDSEISGLKRKIRQKY